MKNIGSDTVISFDDTGSMSSVRKIVRQKATQLVDYLFDQDPDTRVGVIIHNDYCDAPKHIFVQDLTNNKEKIKTFINRDSPCGGGDAAENYEQALFEATKMSWKGEKRSLIMIGDQEPHKVGYRYGSMQCVNDWKEETAKLAKLDVKVYGVQALGNRSSSYFYETISKMTGGVKLDLAQFEHIQTYISAIVANQNGNLEEFEKSNALFGTNLALKNMFRKLRGMTEEKGFTDRVSILSRFQKMHVADECAIQKFVENNGCTFKKGKGYYQLVTRKANGESNWEEIQPNKEVIFVDKLTGETNSDTTWCRNQLGVPFGTRGKVRPLQLPEIMDKYDVFIQSTSVNRKLDRGTEFLYELDEK